MNQDMLDQLIGAAPPSRIDLDAVIGRQRRRSRVRRFGAGGATAAAVVLAVTLGAGLAGGRQQAPAVTSPLPAPPASPPAASPSVSPSAADLTLEYDTAAERRRTLDRLRVVLEEATEEHAPGTKWIYMPDVPGEKRTPDGHPVMFTLNDGIAFRAQSGVTGAGRKGGFYMSLRPIACERGDSCEPFYDCHDSVAECEQIRTPSGLRLVHYVDKPGNGWHFYGVDVMLRDGKHALALRAVNYFGGDGSAPVAATPVFTRKQLDAIATAIALRITG